MKPSEGDDFPLGIEDLEQIFRDRNIIKDEKIISISFTQKIDRYVSKSCYYSVEYSPAKPTQAPLSLFVKTYNQGLSGELTGKKEVQFYQVFPKTMPGFRFLDCYYACYSEEDSTSYLIFRDVRDEINLPQNLDLKNEPDKKELKEVVKYLAEFHAFWWDHEQLGSSVGASCEWDTFNQYMDLNEKRYHYFKELLKHRLPRERRETYERILSNRDILFKRLSSRQNLTIGHCDTNVFNILWPLKNMDTGFYVIDWNYWQIHLGAHDIAYFLSLTLDPEIRRLHEKDLLRFYHECLIANNIQYAWDDFLFDYKLSFASVLFTPVALCSWKLPFLAWWPQYKNCFAAYDEMNCEEIFI